MPTLDQKYTSIQNALGLTDIDPCSHSALLQIVQEQTKILVEESREVVDIISAKSMGNFLGVFGTLMADLFAGAGNAIVEVTIDKILFGNYISASVAAITTAITAIPSFEIVLIYLAAAQLRASLLYRKHLARLLTDELGYLLSFMDALGELFDKDYGDIAFPEIRRSLEHVKTADRLVATE